MGRLTVLVIALPNGKGAAAVVSDVGAVVLLVVADSVGCGVEVGLLFICTSWLATLAIDGSSSKALKKGPWLGLAFILGGEE